MNLFVVGKIYSQQKNGLFKKGRSIFLTLMKISFFYLFFIALSFQLLNASTGKGQTLSETNITISLHAESLKNALSKIEKLSGFLFAYQPELLNDYNSVSLEYNTLSVEEVLKLILKNTDLTYKQQKNYVLILSGNANQNEEFGQLQNRIEGIVFDENQLPLPGATVKIFTSKSATTTTSKDGTFTLPITPQDKEFIVSFLGYKAQTFSIKEGVHHYKVHLQEDSESIEDVIITGYQKINKDNFTGTAITISGEELKRMNPQNLLQSIQAFDPSFKVMENNILGSNPNSLPTINVRGSSSLPSGADEVLRRDNISSNVNLPTFILDGYEVSLEKVYDLDVNRIASITLLKDAAATAVYGSRAANGVLVITTVAPKEGKLQFSYNYEANVSQPDLSAYTVLNAEEKLEYERLAGLYSSNPSLSPDQLQDLYYQKKYNVTSGVNTHWISQPVESVVGQKHSLYIEGGSPTIRYGVDLRYQTMPGIMKESTRDRYGIGMDLSYNLNDKILFKNTLSVSHVKAMESPYGSFASYVRMNPYYPMTDTNGNIVREVDSWTARVNGSITNEVVLNPLYEASLSNFNKSAYLELIDAFSAEWKINNDLRLRGLGSITQKTAKLDQFISPLSNQFYFYPADRLDERGQYYYQNQDETTLDGYVTLNYNKQIKDHFFNLALGANARSNVYDAKSFTATGFTNDRFTHIGFANSYKENSSPQGDIYQDRLFGAFSSLNYSYKNKYLLDASLRADGSSKFGTNNRVAPFWALGLGWNIHKESFLEAVPLISQLKIRASMGVTGAVSFEPFMANTIYRYYNTNWYSTGVGAVVNQYGNDNLKWQRTHNYDIGIDLGMLEDKIMISPRYYYKLTKGLLTDITLPPSTGFSFYKENLGDMRNEGVELNVKANVLKTTNWAVSLHANVVHNTNKIIKISNALKKLNDKTDEAQQSNDLKGVPLLRFQEGQSLNTIYAVRSLGIDPENGNEIFIKKDGSLTYDWNVKDIVPVGDASPIAEGFYGGSLLYKRFLLNISFYTRFGGDQYNQTLIDRIENADPRYNVDRRVLEGRWKNPGDHAIYKNIADLGNTYASDRFVQKDNVIELKSIFLSYDFDHSIFDKIGMQRLRASVTMNDIWRSSSIQIERGINYPFARNVTFSIQTTF